MTASHLPGCPLGESAVPASTCTPCHYIRVGIGLGREMPLIDPRHEPGIGSLIVGPPVIGSLFRTARGWIATDVRHGLEWPDVTARDRDGHPLLGLLRVAYSTTPLPGRPW